MTSLTCTPAELMIVAMAREIEDGDLLAQGIGTTMPACAYFLAKHTHAPNCVFLYSVGGAYATRMAPLSLTGVEELALGSPICRASYSEIVCEHLPGLRFKEFSRPAQVDRFGNTNNVMVRTPSGAELQLPGVGGIPDFSGYESHQAYLYLPRQDTMTLVPRLDVCSGVGANGGLSRERARVASNGPGTRKLVTDLAVIGFSPEGATILSTHPGVTAAQVQERCGFPLRIAEGAGETPLPTKEDLRLIREVIDPAGIRELEMLPGRQRAERVRAIVRAEAAEGRARP